MKKRKQQKRILEGEVKERRKETKWKKTREETLDDGFGGRDEGKEKGKKGEENLGRRNRQHKGLREWERRNETK